MKVAPGPVGHQARASEPVAFSDLVAEALEMLAGSFDETLVEVRIAPDLPVVPSGRGERFRAGVATVILMVTLS